MANVTSDLLQVVTMEIGANNNSWGAIANQNWEKLEKAISDSVTINSTGGTYSLSDDENRAAVLVLTGTLASNLIIEVKARLKWWIVRDQTTRSAYTVTIKPVGGAAVEIPPNARPIIFWCNGSAVFPITPGSHFLGSDLNDSFYRAGAGDLRGKIGGTDVFQMTSAGLTMMNSKVLTGAWAYLPSGTVALFHQAAAPTGWTKKTVLNNYALRIVSGNGGGTGGTVDFTTAFASKSVSGTVGGTSLTLGQIPAHTHTITTRSGTGAAGDAQIGGTTVTSTATTSPAGSGQSHTHSFTGTAIDLAVKYADVILCEKD
jgi:hypothetical protein